MTVSMSFFYCTVYAAPIELIGRLKFFEELFFGNPGLLLLYWNIRLLTMQFFSQMWDQRRPVT
jgi:hypothetical protein